MNTFGKFLHELRVKKDITFRKFCNTVYTLEPNQVSKIERNLAKFPTDTVTLYLIRKALNPTEEEWIELIELGKIDPQPKKLTGKELLGRLPAFIHIDKDKYDEFIDMIRKEHKYNPDECI